MAGRPKRMLAKVTALEREASNLVEAVTEVMPEKYADPDESMKDDPVWLAWYMAAHDMDGAWLWIRELRTLLEEKVG